MLFRNIHKQHYIGAQLVRYVMINLLVIVNVHVISTVMYIDLFYQFQLHFTGCRLCRVCVCVSVTASFSFNVQL